MEPTTVSPEQEIQDLKEQLQILQIAVDRLQKFASPLDSIWILIESRYHPSLPTTNPLDNSSHVITCGEWHCFPGSWRNHLIALKAANDKNQEFATYRISLHGV